MIRLFSSFLIVIGMVCLLITGLLFWERVRPRTLAFKGDIVLAAARQVPVPHKPIGILIPSIHVSLPLIPSYIHAGTWETTTEGVSYLANGIVPGQTGNSILYGHNFPNLLGNLYRVTPGEEIDIMYDNKEMKKFIIAYTTIVTPDTIQILKPSPDKRITLYTCTGLFDTKRFVVVAILAATQKPIDN